ncbi:NAD-dependent epimerase/dehydratase family protein [Azospirillum sp. RWY-5-1]|uniref:NAD-dependent epimerase/dehydratase family protein n=1 Tax=Azospirillum oleiclasticum TaxID=2735135 RepID=A0ABX2TES9_9PROT|nr:NAD-dependent epimerase/dehydratase family protein [Azospirillum oleiclasticum]NYZ15079.1 NAD-dependent epimerase/dehydratase family protein [Azospirillum oleiclasticum]NYZ22841.1 NAD-dependent epimerase/dehydratase family protein [Azospirillum oleiclasticum]
MSRVLVTGATGFVGRHLVPLLLERGHAVRAAVRGTHSLPPQVETALIAGIDAHTDWSAALGGIDAVVHLAARVHVMRDTAADPLAEFRAVNRDGTARLAEFAAAAGVARFVFVSSIKAVCNESRPEPVSDRTPPDPHSPYGVSKREAELALAEIAARSGMQVCVLRPPLVYGPGVGGNFRTLMELVRRGVPLPLGAVDNRRSLLYVGNLADAIERCLNHPGASGGTFLLHDGDPPSTPTLIRDIAGALGLPARLIPMPAGALALAARLAGRSATWDRVGGSLVVDDRGIRSALEWAPPHDRAQGLQATAEWFKARPQG